MKKLLITLCVLLVLAGIGWAVLIFVVIDAQGAAERITQRLQAATGREIVLNADDASVSLWPSPRVAYPNFAIAGAGAEPAFLQADTLQVVLGWGGLSADAKPASITLKQAELNAAMGEAAPNWRFQGSGDELPSYLVDVPIRLENTTLRYAYGGRTTEVAGTNAELQWTAGGQVIFDGQSAAGLRIKGQAGAVDLTSASAASIPLTLELAQDAWVLNLDGMVANPTQRFRFEGAATLKADNVAAMLAGEAAGDMPAASLQAQGALVAVPSAWQWQQVEVTSTGPDNAPVINGKMNLSMQSGADASLILQGQFSRLNGDYLRQLRQRSGFGAEQWQAWWQHRMGRVQVNASTLVLNGEEVRQARMVAQVTDGRLQLEEVAAQLPGEAGLTASGTFATVFPANFRGKAEIKGQSLEGLLNFLAPAGQTVPDQGLDRFLLRGNIAYANQQLQLSELQFAVEKLRASGAIIVKDHASPPVVESFITVQHVNIDHWRKVLATFFPPLRAQATAAQNSSDDAVIYGDMGESRFTWLNAVPYVWRTEWQLNDYTLWGKTGGQTRFKLNIGPGSAALESVNASYNNASITGSYRIQLQPGARPLYNVQGRVSQLDLADISPMVAKKYNDNDWEAFLEQTVQLPFVQSYEGTAQLTFGQLKIKDYIFENISLSSSHSESTLSLDNAQGMLWGGEVSGVMAISAGAIPSFNTAFTIANANLAQYSKISPLLQNAAGVVGMQMELSTSGVTGRSWLTNAEGVVGIVGREIAFSGFGLSTIARAVPVARSVADLERAKQAALKGGMTRFDDVRGQMTIANGEMNMPRLDFASEATSGEIYGKVDLLENTVDLRMEFVLDSTKENGNAPKTVLLLNGPISSVKKELQSQPLDAYVARKSAQRSLRNSP